LKAISGKKFARLLEKHGWELKAIKGSHHVYITPPLLFLPKRTIQSTMMPLCVGN